MRLEVSGGATIMKAFENQTYYDILKIPMDADLNTIKRAYRDALDTYGEEALATYALFSEEQRMELLQTIEMAFHTLIDSGKRMAYDQMLMDSDRIPSSQSQRTADVPDGQEEKADRPRPPDIRDRIRAKFSEEEIQRLSEQVVGKDLVSGIDLKRLREALDVELSEIFEITRISKTTLTSIEENQFSRLPAEVFLRSFLKSYAEILQIDPQRVIEGYLKYMALSEH